MLFSKVKYVVVCEYKVTKGSDFVCCFFVLNGNSIQDSLLSVSVWDVSAAISLVARVALSRRFCMVRCFLRKSVVSLV